MTIQKLPPKKNEEKDDDKKKQERRQQQINFLIGYFVFGLIGMPVLRP